MSYRRIFGDIVAITFNQGRQSLYSRNNGLLAPKFCYIYGYRSRLITTFAPGLTGKRTVFPCSLLVLRDFSSRSSPRNVWRKRVWRIIRGIFVTTGAVFWAIAFVAYFVLEKVSVDVHDETGGSNLTGLERKLMSHFYKEKDEAAILKKDDALDRVWRKLNQEERIKEVFGYPVYICGYNYRNKIEGILEQLEESTDQTASHKGMESRGDETIENVKKGNESPQSEVENDKRWEAGCYIEGSKKVGLLNVMFEQHKQEWIPVALHLKTLEESGEVIGNVSGSLPNGIKNFTRLTN